ncbi:MAG: hypothetical protein P8Z78_15275 [Gammaproteobacteria bacterium]
MTKVIFTLKHLQAIDCSAKNKRMDDQSSTQPNGSKMKKFNSKPTRFKRNVLTLIFATAIGASNTVIAEEELIGSDEFRGVTAINSRMLKLIPVRVFWNSSTISRIFSNDVHAQLTSQSWEIQFDCVFITCLRHELHRSADSPKVTYQ